MLKVVIVTLVCFQLACCRSIQKREVSECATNHCIRGALLAKGKCLQSTNKGYQLCMQGDGNLVIYCLAGGQHVSTWHTGTHNQLIRGGLQFQTDGNLVLYRYDGHALWNSGTSKTDAHKLIMQNDGNLVLYGAYGTVYWNSGTYGKCVSI